MKIAILLVASFAACALANQDHGEIGEFRDILGVVSDFNQCFDSPMNEATLRQRIVQILSQNTNDDLIQLFTALSTTPEGLSLLAKLNTTPDMIKSVLAQLAANPSECELAKTKLAVVSGFASQTLTLKELRTILGVYRRNVIRQEGARYMSQAPVDELTVGLRALASIKRSTIAGIDFKQLSTVLTTNTDNKGRETVVATISTWIQTADCASLKQASDIYQKALKAAASKTPVVAPIVPVAALPIMKPIVNPILSVAKQAAQ